MKRNVTYEKYNSKRFRDFIMNEVEIVKKEYAKRGFRVNKVIIEFVKDKKIQERVFE